MRQKKKIYLYIFICELRAHRLPGFQKWLEEDKRQGFLELAAISLSFFYRMALVCMWKLEEKTKNRASANLLRHQPIPANVMRAAAISQVKGSSGVQPFPSCELVCHSGHLNNCSGLRIESRWHNHQKAVYMDPHLTSWGLCHLL